jgi:hypothetical protein
MNLKTVASVKRGEAAMTWQEIAHALGYGNSRKGARAVFMVYHHAIKKLRQRPHEAQKLKELVEFRNTQRPTPLTFPNCDL